MKAKCVICGNETECQTITSSVVGKKKTVDFVVCTNCAKYAELIKDLAELINTEHKQHAWKEKLLFSFIIFYYGFILFLIFK